MELLILDLYLDTIQQKNPACLNLLSASPFLDFFQRIPLIKFIKGIVQGIPLPEVCSGYPLSFTPLSGCHPRFYLNIIICSQQCSSLECHSFFYSFLFLVCLASIYMKFELILCPIVCIPSQVLPKLSWLFVMFLIIVMSSQFL